MLGLQCHPVMEVFAGPDLREIWVHLEQVLLCFLAGELCLKIFETLHPLLTLFQSFIGSFAGDGIHDLCDLRILLGPLINLFVSLRELDLSLRGLFKLGLHFLQLAVFIDHLLLGVPTKIAVSLFPTLVRFGLCRNLLLLEFF